MTAKEILENIHITYLSKAETALIKGTELTVLPYGYLTQACEEAMKEYAEMKCAEQREICAQHYAYDSVTNDSNNYEIAGKGLKHTVMCEIENAPKPNFD